MGKIAAKVINVSLATVAIEDELTSASLNVTQEVPVVTGLSDTGPRRVVGNYDYNAQLEGAFDGASAQGDATIFGMVGASSAKALAFDPTGASAGADDPNYDATDVVLESYTISGSVGNPVTYSATVQGNSALARNVA